MLFSFCLIYNVCLVRAPTRYLAVYLLFMRCRKVRNPSNRYNPLKVFAWDDFLLNDKRGNFQVKILLPLDTVTHTYTHALAEKERLPCHLLFCALQDTLDTKWRRWKKIDDNKYAMYPFVSHRARYIAKQPHIQTYPSFAFDAVTSAATIAATSSPCY